MNARRPATLQEALAIRAGDDVIPFAGGTDLMARLRRGAGALPAFFKPVLFLDRCGELGRLAVRGGRLDIGATVTLSTLADSPLVPPLLRSIALSMGGPAIRNLATLGGNVCNASPAGDTLPFLHAMDARVTLVSLAGTREVPVEEFITGPGATRLRRDELLLGVSFPVPVPPRTWWRKVGTRKANALTKASLVAMADGEGDDGRLHGVRIALGAVGPTVIRLRELERYLEGMSVSEAASAAAPEAAGSAARIRDLTAAAIRPIDDQRSTAEYRRRVAVNLVEEALRRFSAGSVDGRAGVQFAPERRGPST